MKSFIEAAAKKWFTLAWKDKIAGAFTNSSSFSGDKLNTLVGLVINAMQHGMIYVGLGLLPSANRPDDFQSPNGPAPDAHKPGWFLHRPDVGKFPSQSAKRAGERRFGDC